MPSLTMDQRYFINHNQENYQELEKCDLFLNRLGPENLCPFAAHTIYPYFFSFKKGSWFRWEKHKDSVAVRCPNPDNYLSFKITRKSDKSIQAEVSSCTGTCIANHKIGERFELTDPEGAYLKHTCLNNAKLEKSLAISVYHHNRSCRYYRPPGENLPMQRLAPQGFCFMAYYTAYPYALSLLYDGRGFEDKKSERFDLTTCQNDSHHLNIEVRTQRKILAFAWNLLEKSLRAIGIPRDVLDKSIFLTVRTLEGNCPQNLKTGQIAKFNLRNNKELCPAVFYTMFPYLIMANKSIFPYWAKDKKEFCVHCPTVGGNVVYKVESSHGQQNK